MRRVLMVEYYFPPLGGIGAVRAARFASLLPEFGWRPTVLSPSRGAYYRDPTLEQVLEPGPATVRTPSLELSRIGKQALRLGDSDIAAARTRGALTHLRNLARRWVYMPDAQIGWLPFAVTAGRRVLSEGRHDALFSSSFPITAHLVAERLHRDFGIPWVAEFRDLWTDLGHYDSPRRRRIDLRLERRLLTTASHVVTVSPTWARLLSERAGRDVSVITNGFDPPSGPAPTPVQTTVTYVGSYYPDRQDLVTAIRALGELHRSRLLQSLRLVVVGDLNPRFRALCVEAGIDALLSHTGFQAHSESLRLMREASLLLLAGPPASGGDPVLRGNIAAKAFEYLGAQRPILYVGDVDADVAAILASFERTAAVRPGDTAGAKAAVLRLLGGPDEPRTGLLPYTRRNLTRDLARVLGSVA